MRGATQGPEVSLEQVLESRDQRAQDQRQWLARGGVLVCMTLNMPGPRKRFPLADAAFRQGERLLEDQLAGGGLTVLERQEMDRPAGLEYFLRVQGRPDQAKDCALALEERPPLGRLLDIDVGNWGARLGSACFALVRRRNAPAAAPMGSKRRQKRRFR